MESLISKPEMNKLSLLLVALTIFVWSCNSGIEGHLNNGLKDLNNFRKISHQFKDSISISGIVFLRNGKNKFDMIIKLSSEESGKQFEKYSLGVHTFSNHQTDTITKVKTRYNWDFKPESIAYGKHHYILKTVEAPIKFIDSMRLFLYNREKYNGKSYGRSLWVKNIGL